MQQAPKSAVVFSFKDEKLMRSFEALFKEGMKLVEDVAKYLDGPFRKEAKKFQGPLGVELQVSSMKLTSLLLEMASWLLLERDVQNVRKGEEAFGSQATRPEVEKKLRAQPNRTAHFEQLPDQLQAFWEKAESLRRRLVNLLET